MKKKTKKQIKEYCSTNISCGGCGGFAYFLGFLGAAIYYISASTGLWNGVVGFVKALVWPAFLVYDLLKFLGT